MIYLQQNSLNTIYIDVSSFATISSPVFLWSIQNSQGKNVINFIPENVAATTLNQYAGKYDVFQFNTDKSLPIQQIYTSVNPANIHLDNENQYWVSIYEQSDPSNLDPNQSGTKLINSLAFVYPDVDNEFYSGNTGNTANNVIYYKSATPITPSPTPSSTTTPTPTPTITSSLTPTPSITPTYTPTPSPTPGFSFYVGVGFDTAMSGGFQLSNGDMFVYGSPLFYQNEIFEFYGSVDSTTGSRTNTITSSIPYSTGSTGNIINDAKLFNNGKIIVAGFWQYGLIPNSIILLNSDGTIDLTFNPGGSVNSSIRSVALMENETYVVAGGLFSSPSNRIFKMDMSGNTDPTFQSNIGSAFGTSTINKVLVDSNDNIYAGGSFTTFNGSSVKRGLIKLDKDGNVDTTFQTNIGTGINSGVVYNLVDDGSGIIVLGTFTSVNGLAWNRIFKIGYDGTPDPIWGNNGFGFRGFSDTTAPTSAAINPATGNLIIVYTSGLVQSSYNTTLFSGRILSLDPSGQIITTFGDINNVNYGFIDFNPGTTLRELNPFFDIQGNIYLTTLSTTFNTKQFPYFVKLDSNGNLITRTNP